jgi:DNA-binding NarL/FixJ family response regulator
MSQEEKIKVIVVDDHELFRLGVCSMLKANREFEVIGEASSGNMLLEMLENGSMPDIIVLDIVMPGLSGLEVATKIKTQYPSIKILLLSSEKGEDIVSDAIKIGVEGFLSKLDLGSDLPKAIKAIIQGSKFYGKEISEIMYAVLVAEKVIGNQKQSHHDKLFSERELEIISLCANGLKAREIAEKLFISKRTVEWHRTNIFQKLGINNNLELVRYAIQKGIVEF